MSINYFKNAKVKKLESASTKSYLYLDTDLKVPFHVSLLATGSSKYRKKFKLFGLDNYFMSDSIFDKPAMNRRLNSSKKIVIRRLNLESLEIASLISSQFPDKKILILDSETRTSLHEILGNHVANQMIHWMKTKGVHFNLGRCITELHEKPNGDIIIELEKRKSRAQQITTNMVIDADNLLIANNELLTSK